MRLDGARLYLAQGWQRIGAAAIQTPVVHVEMHDGALVLRVGSQQGAWYGWGDAGVEPGRVDLEVLRIFFAALGTLETVEVLTP